MLDSNFNYMENQNNKYIDIFITPNKKDVHYLYEYVPKCEDYLPSKCSNWSKELLYYKDITMKIWDYKYSDDEEVINFFTDQFMKAISHICEVYFKNILNIALVAVPSSKEKFSQTKQSIDIIKKWHEKGITNEKYNCSKEFFNYSELLFRSLNISSQKDVPINIRNDKQRQLDSISYSIDFLPKNFGYILVDDVTTSGTTLDSCRDKLINLGIKKEKIVCLALGETLLCTRDLKCDNDEIVLCKNRKSI